jgi:hypothetical protein
VLEGTYESLADFEQSAKALMSKPEWQGWYPRVIAVSQGGYREILNVVE